MESSENSAYVFSGAPAPEIPNSQYRLNENIFYDPETDSQKIARTGFSQTKLYLHSASLSIFQPSANKVFFS